VPVLITQQPDRAKRSPAASVCPPHFSDWGVAG